MMLSFFFSVNGGNRTFVKEFDTELKCRRFAHNYAMKGRELAVHRMEAGEVEEEPFAMFGIRDHEYAWEDWS